MQRDGLCTHAALSCCVGVMHAMGLPAALYQLPELVLHAIVALGLGRPVPNRHEGGIMICAHEESLYAHSV